MKKGIRSDSNNRKVLTSKKIYDCVATELPDGRMMELHKSYVTLHVFTDNGFIKTSTEYKCPYCNKQEKTEIHTTKQEQDKITIEIYCKACKQILISETISKSEL